MGHQRRFDERAQPAECENENILERRPFDLANSSAESRAIEAPVNAMMISEKIARSSTLARYNPR